VYYNLDGWTGISPASIPPKTNVHWTQAGLYPGSVWAPGYVFIRWEVYIGGSGNVSVTSTYASLAYSDADGSSITMRPRFIPYDPGPSGGDGGGTTGGGSGTGGGSTTNNNNEPEDATATTVTPETNPAAGLPPGTIVDTSGGNQTSPVTSIAGDETPTYRGIGNSNSWQLMDVILAFVSAVLAVLMAVYGFKRKEDDEEGEPKPVAAPTATIGVILAVVVALIVLLTQNFTGSMQIVDIWTIPIGVIALIQAILFLRMPSSEPDLDEPWDGAAEYGTMVE